MRPAWAPLRAITTAPSATPEMQRDQQRRRDRRAEEQTHHAGELDVAHTHAAGVGERGQQQEAAGGERRDQPFGLAGGVEREADRDARAPRRGR